MAIRQIVIAIWMGAMPAVAFAGPGTTVPEPETLTLLAAGVVAWLVVRLRKRK
jgi:hypothetical protein